MSAADDLRKILTTYPVGIYVIDTLEISHSLFQQRYLFTREPSGITAISENSEILEFVGTNFEPVLNTAQNDLDTVFAFTLPDPFNAVDDALALIPLSNSEPILTTYRQYNSDDFSEPAALFRLQVLGIAQEKGKFTFQAGAVQLNWGMTGQIYSYERFPMLRAL